jgi:hypothetical protein
MSDQPFVDHWPVWNEPLSKITAAFDIAAAREKLARRFNRTGALAKGNRGRARVGTTQGAAMKYAIIVREQSGNETELCRVNSNPEAVAEGARRKVFRVKSFRTSNGRRVPKFIDLPKYAGVRIEEIKE